MASRLADRGHVVIFFQHPISPSPSSLIRNYREDNLFAIRKIKENLYVVNMFLPRFFGKLEFFTKKLGSMTFRVYLKCLHFKPDVAIFYSYPYVFLLDDLKSRGVKTIYDCPDEFSEFSYVNKPKILKAETDLSINCSAVITVSRKLCEKISKLNSNCFYVPNAADFEHFSKAMHIKEKPRELKLLRRPVIGFIGVVYDWINVDLICKLAESHPNYSILIVGPVRYGLDKLKEHANIVMAGHKKFAVLPQYLACMDVCLIPFKLNKLTLASNPIKLYEYLAAGKPVVSTALPEVRENASGLVYIAKDEKDFMWKVDEAVKEAESPNKELIMRRIKFAKENSWEKRIETIEKLLNL
jgi:glycosyltransferase involved in cell wall biosynthesis